MLEAVIALAVLLRDYDVESLVERVPPAPRITLHPAAPVPCRLRARRGGEAPGAPAQAARVAPAHG
jgi:cytochrome P450